jgi:predicted DNA binding CopG/RHH family protein
MFSNIHHHKIIVPAASIDKNYTPLKFERKSKERRIFIRMASSRELFHILKMHEGHY